MSELRSYSESADGDKHSGIPSSFQGIMADILAEIFLWSVQMDTDANEVTSHNWESRAPMNVAAVCRHWAAVALSWPSLWSTFRGRDTRTRTRTRNSMTDFPWKHLETFLHRSQRMPFSLSIRIDRGTPMDYEKLLDVLPRNATRFKTLNINWFTREDFEKIWMINLLPFSSLEDLHLQIGSCSMTKRVNIHLSGTLRLKRLHLNGPFTLIYDGPARFPSLVSAHLSYRYILRTHEAPDLGLRWHDCLLLMQASPSLTTVFAAVKGNFQGTVEPGPIIKEPSLIHYKITSLDLTFRRGGDAQHLFEHLHLPSLTDLTLEVIYLGRWSSAFGEMISRSKATIKKFVICGYEFSEAMQCLQYMPALQTFMVNDRKGANGFKSAGMRVLITRLTLKPEFQLCPELEHIGFTSCGNPALCSERLVAMICSRWDRSVVGDRRCLRSVTFEDHRVHWEFPYPSQVLQFCREGLVIIEEKGPEYPSYGYAYGSE